MFTLIRHAETFHHVLSQKHKKTSNKLMQQLPHLCSSDDAYDHIDITVRMTNTNRSFFRQ